MRRLRSLALALALSLVLSPALAGGRAGYRLEAGQRFTVRLWAEEVLASWGPIEQVAGAEMEYDPRTGIYWSPYTGLGWTGDTWWVQVQGRIGLQGMSIVLIGGWSW